MLYLLILPTFNKYEASAELSHSTETSKMCFFPQGVYTLETEEKVKFKIKYSGILREL